MLYWEKTTCKRRLTLNLRKTLQNITKKSENEQKRKAVVKGEIERVTNILKTTANVMGTNYCSITYDEFTFHGEPISTENVVRAVADHLKKEGLNVELSTYYEMNFKHYNLLARW